MIEQSSSPDVVACPACGQHAWSYLHQVDRYLCKCGYKMDGEKMYALKVKADASQS
jgi:hypothetical protein